MFELELEQKERPLEEGIQKKIILGVVFFFIATTFYVVEFIVRRQCPYWLNIIILTIVSASFIGCIINVVELIQTKQQVPYELNKASYKGKKFAVTRDKVYCFDQKMVLGVLEKYTDDELSMKVYLEEDSKPKSITVWVLPEPKNKSILLHVEKSNLKKDDLAKVDNLLGASAKT